MSRSLELLVRLLSQVMTDCDGLDLLELFGFLQSQLMNNCDRLGVLKLLVLPLTAVSLVSLLDVYESCENSDCYEYCQFL